MSISQKNIGITKAEKRELIQKNTQELDKLNGNQLLQEKFEKRKKSKKIQKQLRKTTIRNIAPLFEKKQQQIIQRLKKIQNKKDYLTHQLLDSTAVNMELKNLLMKIRSPELQEVLKLSLNCDKTIATILEKTDKHNSVSNEDEQIQLKEQLTQFITNKKQISPELKQEFLNIILS